MDKVIRAGRLAPGRTVLALPPVGGPHPTVSPLKAVASAPATADVPRPVSPDLHALRREIEAKVLAEHGQRLEDALADARERGRREGLAQGLLEGRTTAAAEAARAAAALRAQAEAALASLAPAHAAAWADFRSQVGEAAFVAVCRVLGTRPFSRESVQGVVETVCQSVRADTAVTVRLHPRDAALLVGEASALSLPSGLRIAVVADDTLTAGGCIVDAPTGRFDGSLEIQLARLRDVMAGAAAA